MRLWETAKIHAGALGDSEGVKHLYYGKNPRVRKLKNLHFLSLEKERLYSGVVIGNLPK